MFTVLAAESPNWLKSAVASAPSATFPPDQFDVTLQVPPVVAVIHVLSVAYSCDTIEKHPMVAQSAHNMHRRMTKLPKFTRFTIEESKSTALRRPTEPEIF